MRWRPRYSESEIREAVESSPSIAASLRRLGLRTGGANPPTLRRHIEHFGVSTSHFNPNWSLRAGRPAKARPLSEILVTGSNYNRGALKQRLYDSELKERRCELCGQGEEWHGRPMALILDHINGVGNDNRIENLRIACANCAATLDTHCGRRSRIERLPRRCLHCGGEFRPKYFTQRYCSQPCASHHPGSHAPQPERRKVERPTYDQLLTETQSLGFRAVGRKYGVSDNAVRKWIRAYEAERECRNEREERG